MELATDKLEEIILTYGIDHYEDNEEVEAEAWYKIASALRTAENKIKKILVWKRKLLGESDVVITY